MAASAASGAGIVSVTVDGTTTQYKWAEAEEQLRFWERRAANAAGRKMVRTIDLRNT